MFPSIDPLALKRRLDDGTAFLVDVREPDEHARERIHGSRLVPLSALGRQELEHVHGRAVVFYCRSGNRTGHNAARLLALAPTGSYHLAGGIEAWKRAGLPVDTDRSQPIELMRQIQIAAGLMVLSGVLLGFLVSPWLFGLSAFVGAGLVVAGVTGFCGMARLLRAMPWNRHAPTGGT